MYDLELLPNCTKTHDARAPDGRMVQVKATQGTSVSISSEPDHLLVLALDEHGRPSEVFNGPGHLPWEAAGKLQKTGQRPLRFSTLRKLMASVPDHARLTRLR
jgi:hypothetical protein